MKAYVLAARAADTGHNKSSHAITNSCITMLGKEYAHSGSEGAEGRAYARRGSEGR